MSTPHPKRRRLDGPVHKPFRSPLKTNNPPDATRSPATRPSPLSTTTPTPTTTQTEIPDSDESSPSSANAPLELPTSAVSQTKTATPTNTHPSSTTETELLEQISLLKAHISSRSSPGLAVLERKWLLASRSAAELLLPSFVSRGVSRNPDREERLRSMLGEMEGVLDAGVDGGGEKVGVKERGGLEEEIEGLRERIRCEEDGEKGQVGMEGMLRAVIGEEMGLMGWDEEEGGWRDD